MKAIYKRELCSYFRSMLGYVFVAVTMAFIGLYFMVYNLTSGYPYFSYTLNHVFIVFMFLTPLLTMKSMAEERKTRTDQLLLTSPASVTSVVMGKFLSVLTVFAIPLLISCFCPLIISAFGTGYMAGDYVMIFAVLCLGALLVSIGLFISSLTDNQVIAAVVTFLVFMVLYMWDGITNYLPTDAVGSFVGFLILWLIVSLVFYLVSKNRNISIGIAAVGIVALVVVYAVKSTLYEGLLTKVLSVFSIVTPLSNFASYTVFDFAGIFYYLSCTALFLFLTVQSIQKRRWN